MTIKPWGLFTRDRRGTIVTSLLYVIYEEICDTSTIVHIAVLLISGSDNFLDETYIENLGKGDRTTI